MKEKKTVLFLMNGFGVESNKSFEVYSKETMPTFDKLIGAYPFKLLYASGEMIGANKDETSNFQTGYYTFSTFGQPHSKDEVIKKKIANKEFFNNEVINNSIDIALKNKSRLHVMLSLGNTVKEERFQQFNTYVELATQKGIKEIFVHLVLGESSNTDLKIGNKCIYTFKNRVIRFHPQVKIASICSKKYLTDGTPEDIATFYRMMVSGVGEVWTDYEGTIKKKYELGMTDDNMNGFITIRENLLREKDSIFMFNYRHTFGKQFISIIKNSKSYFPTSKVPENISVNSLFAIDGAEDVTFAFKELLPKTYFFEKIPEDKKILVIGSKTRLPQVTNYLNGYRKEFGKNVSVWPINDGANRFADTSQYLAAYINQDIYDLIIVDCQLYEPSMDKRTIEQIQTNLTELDKCLNITYNQVMKKDYRLIATSLYGISARFKLTATMELVDLSQKTPFLLVDKEIRRVDIAFKKYGTFIDVSKIIAISYGNNMKNDLVVIDTPSNKKKSNKIKLLIIAIPLILLLILVIVYIKMLNF